MEPLYFFQNFELDNNTIIKQRFPQSTMPESSEVGLNVEAFTTNTFFSTGDIYSTPNDATSLDIVMDVEYLPVPAQTNTTVYHYMFGLSVYRGLRFLTPTEYTNLGIDPTFGESPTPRRVVMQIYIRKVNDAYFLTKLIDGQVAYENARITRNPFGNTVTAGRLTLVRSLAPRDLLRVYKVAIIANHDKMMRYDPAVYAPNEVGSITYANNLPSTPSNKALLTHQLYLGGRSPTQNPLYVNSEYVTHMENRPKAVPPKTVSSNEFVLEFKE